MKSDENWWDYQSSNVKLVFFQIIAKKNISKLLFQPHTWMHRYSSSNICGFWNMGDISKCRDLPGPILCLLVCRCPRSYSKCVSWCCSLLQCNSCPHFELTGSNSFRNKAKWLSLYYWWKWNLIKIRKNSQFGLVRNVSNNSFDMIQSGYLSKSATNCPS